MLAGCSGGSFTSSPAFAASAASTRAPNVTVLLQDAPADSVAAFNIDMTTATLNGAGWQAVVLTNSRQTMELRHMELSPSVAFQGYAPPSGTYNSLRLSLTNPQLAVLNANGKVVRVNSETSPSAKLATSNVTIPLTVTVGNLSHVNLMLDFDLEHSITNDANGNYIINPVIKASVLENSAPPVKIQGALASVTAISLNGPQSLNKTPINAVSQGTSNHELFGVQLHDTDQAIPVVVDSSTVIDGVIGQLSNLHMGQLIYLSGDFQNNGALVASSIAARPTNSSRHYQGPVTGVYKDSSGNESFDVVVQN